MSTSPVRQAGWFYPTSCTASISAMSAGGKALWVDESVCVEAPQVAGHLKSKVLFFQQKKNPSFWGASKGSRWESFFRAFWTIKNAVFCWRFLTNLNQPFYSWIIQRCLKRDLVSNWSFLGQSSDTLVSPVRDAGSSPPMTWHVSVVEKPPTCQELASWRCKQLASANFPKDFCVAILSPCQPLLVKARHLDLEGTHTFLNLWCTAGLELPKNDGSDRGRPEPQNRTDLASNFANFQSLYRMLKLLKLGEVIFLKNPENEPEKCTSFVPKHQTKRYFEESKAVVAILEPFHLFLRETHPNFEEETPVTPLTLHWISTGWWGWPSTPKYSPHVLSLLPLRGGTNDHGTGMRSLIGLKKKRCEKQNQKIWFIS